MVWLVERLRTRFCTIRVLKNSYSLHSRLIGEKVDIRIYAEHIEAWYAQRRIEVLPRLRGENGHYINYRHVINTLVRKPGAFENYRYKDDMFPTSHPPSQPEDVDIIDGPAKHWSPEFDEALRPCQEKAEFVGLLMTPIVVVQGEVKHQGSVPSIEQLKLWLA